MSSPLHPVAPYGLVTPRPLEPLDDRKPLIADQAGVLTLDQLGRVSATAVPRGKLAVPLENLLSTLSASRPHEAMPRGYGCALVAAARGTV